jgi:hypothetical protein
MEGVNQNQWKRGYGARDKEELIERIINLHDQGISTRLYEYGDIKLNRKYEKFLSLMI